LQREQERPSGVTAWENDMTTTTLSLRLSALAPVLFTAVLGIGVIFLASHAQSAALHDAAHDMRHATGFPCH
jgi:cobalt transporter subunit CbtB